MRRLIVAGTVTMLAGGGLLAAAAASGAAEGAADFGNFSLRARNAAIDVQFDDKSNSPAHPAGQASIPEVVATLESGPIGRGFSTIFWPGPLGGNFGSLVQLMGGPKEAELLNDPIRAEAQSGSTPDAKYDQIPGVTMVAHAENQLVTANGGLTAVGLPGVFTVGNVTGSSRVELKNGAGVAESVSRLTDVAIGPDGVLKIGSIVSTSTASTDATMAKGEGHTVISGVTVAGQPATIDETGIHFGSTKTPNPLADAVNEAGKQALSQAGITVAVSTPLAIEKGAQGDYTSGSIVVSWASGQGQSISVVLGNASTDVVAAPGFDDALGDLTGAGVLGADAPPPSDLGAPPVDGGDLGAVSTPARSSAPVTGTAAQPEVALQPEAAKPIGHFKGLAPGLVLLVLGAALVAAGSLRRLPAAVLTPTGTVCNAEGDRT